MFDTPSATASKDTISVKQSNTSFIIMSRGPVEWKHSNYHESGDIFFLKEKVKTNQRQ
jgi:hypothetical protein